MSKVEITPDIQHVYPWGITGISQDVKESLLSSYKVIGNNIVLNNLTTSVSHNNNSVLVTIHPGTAIQDSALLELDENITLSLNVTGLDQTGCLVSYIFFSGQSTEFKLGLTYLDNSNVGEWDIVNNKIILNVYKFTKDTYNSVTLSRKTDKDVIDISGQTYYRKGIHHNNIYMSNLLSTIIHASKQINNDYTASLNETIFANTSNGEFTIFLPEKPPVGTKITIIDSAGTFWDKSLKVDPNGSKINNEPTYLFFRFKNSITDFYYSGEEFGWIYNITRMWSLKGGTF